MINIVVIPYRVIHSLLIKYGFKSRLNLNKNKNKNKNFINNDQYSSYSIVYA
jgi:hypothetical protein